MSYYFTFLKYWFYSISQLILAFLLLSSLLILQCFAAAGGNDNDASKSNSLTSLSVNSGESATTCTTGSCPPVDNGSNSTASNNDTELLLAQVIFRHGDRMPIFPYPKDPHRNSTVLKKFERKGLLTKKGKVQAHELGTFLRFRYKEFLKGAWIPEQVHIQSSTVERAIMTAQVCLSGLFPPCSDELVGCEGRWNSQIRWQPVPVYPIPSENDNKINFRPNSCPAYVQEFYNVLNCNLMLGFVEQYRETFKYLQEHTGLEEVNMETVGRIYDTLFIESLNGLTLPEWTKKVYPEPLKTLQETGFQVISSNRNMMKFRGGPLLKEVIDNMKKTVKVLKCPKKTGDESRRDKKKLFLYSGHDTTVATFLSCLGVFETHQPPFASAVMVELHEMKDMSGDVVIKMKNKNQKPYIVKVFYRNDTKLPPQEMIIPGCGNPCYLNKLKETVRDLLIQDWEGECNSNSLTNWFFWVARPLTAVFTYLFSVFRRFFSMCGCRI